MANILLCALLCALVLRASGVTRSETFPDGAAALPEPPCARGALCKETPPGGSCCDPSEGEEAPVDQQQDRPALEERRMAVPSGGQMRATLRLPADVPYGLFLFAFCTVLVFLVVFCCSSCYFRGYYSRKKRSSTEQLQQSCPEGQVSLESPGPSDVDLPLHHGASAEMALPLVVADEPSDLLDCTPAEQLQAGNCEAKGNTVSPGTIPLPTFPPRDREPTVENESEDKMERPKS